MTKKMEVQESPRRPEGVTREQVRVLKKAGVGYRQIAATLGISTQAVYYHFRQIKLEDEAKKKRRRGAA